MTETKRLKVFLCHAHSDATAVRDLFGYLRREGVDVWLDKESLLPGVDWDSEIRKAVRASDVVVVCLSNEFNKAGYRQREVRIALDTEQEKPDGEIYIIPARLEACDVPEKLSKWQWVDLFEKGGRQKLIKALRVRAASVGAGLRSRRDQKSDASQPKDREGRVPNPERINELTNTLLDWRKEKVEILPPWSKKEEQSRAPSGIWIDGQRNLWRDATNLGQLNEVEYKLLSYLIAHKNHVCTYSALYAAAFGDTDSGKEMDYLAVATMMDRLILRIEIDPKENKFIDKMNTGFIMIGEDYWQSPT